MKSEETFEIQLMIAATGDTYSAEISSDTTVQQIVDAFMDIHYLDPKFGLGWKLLYSGQVLANDAIVSKLVAGTPDTTFQLIAKVQGA